MSEDVLTSNEAGGKVIRGSVLRVAANAAGLLLGLATATLLLRHLGVENSGRYVTVLSLVGIAVSVVDTGLNVTASSELARRDADARRPMLADLFGQRLLAATVALILLVAFALIAGYPEAMVSGTALAGTGVLLVAVANSLLVPLTVQLRNGGLALIELLRQVATLVGIAVLVAVGATLTPFFAVQIAVGLIVLAAVPLLVGRAGLVRPRFDRAAQRDLLRTALPVAAALALGQIYFRLVIVLMSLISSAEQTGYFGASLRAMEAMIVIPVLVATVALPLLTAAGRDDLPRLRYAIAGLSEGAVIGGILVALVTFRAAEPAMSLLGGPEFSPAADVLRIQILALVFIALYQIWTVGLVALDRQRELVLANSLGLFALAVFAPALVLPFGAEGGAVASVLGDAVLACLIYWRLQRSTGRVSVRASFLARVAVAAAAALVPLFLPELPNLLAAALAAVVFLGTALLVGAIPEEMREAFRPDGPLPWRRGIEPPQA